MKSSAAKPLHPHSNSVPDVKVLTVPARNQKDSKRQLMNRQQWKCWLRAVGSAHTCASSSSLLSRGRRGRCRRQKGLFWDPQLLSDRGCCWDLVSTRKLDRDKSTQQTKDMTSSPKWRLLPTGRLRRPALFSHGSLITAPFQGEAGHVWCRLVRLYLAMKCSVC